MKSNTTKEYNFTGDSYAYTLGDLIEGSTERIKTYDAVPTNIQMSMTVNLLGELIIDSLTKVQINSYLDNVLDRNGEEVYTDGLWEIIQTAPILGPMGIKAGYRYRAKLIGGNV